MSAKDLFEIIQKTFFNIMYPILENKYIKALYLTLSFILAITLVLFLMFLGIEYPIVGGIEILIIIYLLILSDME